jgi:AcrR family transcriptional regulator
VTDETPPQLDGRVVRGDAKRRAILDLAVDLASAEGLEGLSIGRLAGELGISKSGVVLHFGSKEEMQLATISTAVRRIHAEVIVPAEREPEGVVRLWTYCDRWLASLEGSLFAGGCFFSTVGAEFNARPGRVHDAIAAAHATWLTVLRDQAAIAFDNGQLDGGGNPEQLIFELDSVIRSSNLYSRLHGDNSAFDRARQTIRERLATICVDDATRRRLSVHPKKS